MAGRRLINDYNIMQQSVNQLYRDKLGDSDGEIGGVKDFYFDDQNWAIRYIVADTGSWLPGRHVLLSPRALGQLYQPGKLLFVNLTRQQIVKTGHRLTGKKVQIPTKHVSRIHGFHNPT
jgi:hypothetical protein